MKLFVLAYDPVKSYKTLVPSITSPFHGYDPKLDSKSELWCGSGINVRRWQHRSAAGRAATLQRQGYTGSILTLGTV